MHLQKIIASASLFALLAPMSVNLASADATSDMKASIMTSFQALLQKYEERITALETQNEKLADELATLKKGTTPVAIVTPTTPATPTVTPATTTPTSTTPVVINTGTEKYDKLVKMANDIFPALLSENNIDAKADIGLFEFIEPNAFFISVDDGKNLAGVTAFPYKFLYTYDKNYTLTKIGSFKLNQEVQLYATLSGSNPFAKSTRIRIKNPLYKGKLLEEAAATTTTPTTSTTTTKPTTTTPVATITTPVADVTYDQIKKAYDKNDIINAIKLSDAYLAKNDGTADIYRIRYRGYYMMGKYIDSLAAVKKLEALKPTDFAKIIACDAVVIAKLGKQPDSQTYYAGLCKK